MEILNVKNLTFKYPKTEKAAIKNLSFSMERGDLTVLFGGTGSGKSTLLSLLKTEISPFGKRDGEIFVNGKYSSEYDVRASAEIVGYVSQHPEDQIVTDRVWHELAFGMENLGYESEIIRRRVAETASYFGIEKWFDKKTSELSGGQKQILNLASVMVMRPKILLLDEPTSQLDPIAAANFIRTVVSLNRDLGLTVLISEHRLEELLPLSKKSLVLKNGELCEYGDTRSVVSRLSAREDFAEYLPTAARLYGKYPFSDTQSPMTVAEGREYLEGKLVPAAKRGNLPENTSNINNNTLDNVSGDAEPCVDNSIECNTAKRQVVALELSDVFFRYARQLPDVLSGLDLKVYEKEIYCLLGGNGAGKSTALSVACGVLKPYAGKVKLFGEQINKLPPQKLYGEYIAMLPQEVKTLFLKNTVREELEERNADTSLIPYNIDELMDRHPYDLSGGQQQLVALLKTVANKPKILLLDEPTKGLDAYAKSKLVHVLKHLRNSLGMTIVTVTHDAEFAAALADRCALFFRGETVTDAPPREFFSDNNFYTTAAAKMSFGILPDIATLGDIEAALEKIMNT